MDRRQSKTISTTLFVLAIAIFLAGAYVRSSINDANGHIIWTSMAVAKQNALKADFVLIACTLVSIVVGGAGFYMRSLHKK